MRRSMIYGTLVLFLLFMITASPGETGEDGRDFVSWLSSGWDDTREFMGSLIGDEQADTNELGEVPIPSVAPAPGSEGSGDVGGGEGEVPAVVE